MESIERGFITIEVVIALAILSLTFGGLAALLSDSISGTGRTRLRFHADAQALMLVEHIRQLAHADSRLIQGQSTTSVDGIEESVVIGDSLSDPYQVRTATAIVSWQWGASTSTDTLSTALTDYHNPGSFDTCGSLDGDWAQARVVYRSLTSSDLLAHVTSGHSVSVNNPIAGLDVYRGLIVVGVATTSSKTNDSLFVLDTNFRYLGGIDTNAASIDGTASLVHNDSYVFVANPHAANFRTCKTGPSCSQLQVIDIHDPGVPVVSTNMELPTSSGPMIIGTGGQAVGKSITLVGHYIYLGLTKSASGPEFNIIDVSDALHPHWIGGYTLGAAVSNIDVRDGYAYIATDSSTQELTILDVRDPSQPTLVGTYNVTDGVGWGNGNSVYTIGTTTYLGLTYAAGKPDLYVLSSLDRLLPFDISSTTASSTISGIIARTRAVYVLNTTAQVLQIFEVSSSVPVRIASYDIHGQGRVLDCERNTLYVGSDGVGTITMISL